MRQGVRGFEQRVLPAILHVTGEAERMWDDADPGTLESAR